MLLMSLIGIVILSGFTFYFSSATNKMNNKLKDMDNIIQQSTDLYTKMIETQVVIQSYVNDLNSGTATILKGNISDLEKTAEKLEKKQGNKKIAASFGAIAKSIKLYLDSFNQLSSMQKIIGDSSNTGLRKEMSNSIQTLQKMAKAGNDSDLKRQLDLLELYQNTYISNPDESNYKAAKKAAKKFDSLFSHSNLARKDKDKFSNDLLKYTSAFDTVHQSYQTMQELSGDFTTTTQQVNKNVSSISKQLAKERQDIIHHRASLSRLLTVILIVASVIGIGLLCVFGWWLLRSINSSIASLKHGAAIIGEGNLAHRVDLGTSDEMAELATTFNNMAEKMQRSLQKVSMAADHLSSSSQNLASVSEETTAQANEVNEAITQVSAGAQSQADHLEESTELITSVTASVRKTADYGNQIAKDAASAEKQGKVGLETVNRLHQTSEQFIGLASRLIDEVQKTSEQSKQINSIVETIKEIAGNTDLLALNAAIESARAGEAGRGFAVVADEVRKLAERSKTEAQHIQKLVNTTVEQMNKLAEEAKRLNSYREEQGTSVNQTKNAFEEIVTNVGAINQRMIAAQEAIQQMEASNHNLSAKLEEVSAISEESAASAQQVSAASNQQKQAIEQVNRAAFELQNIAIDLQQEVNLFQLIQTGQQEKQIEKPEDLYLAEKETAATIEE